MLIQVLLFLIIIIIIVLIVLLRKHSILGGSSDKSHDDIGKIFNDDAQKESIDRDLVGGGDASGEILEEIAHETDINSEMIGGGASTVHEINALVKVAIVNTNRFAVHKASKRKADWTKYHTWDLLKKHRDSLSNYIYQRNNILSNPDIKWDKVMTLMMPKLNDDCEYIGLVNVEEDGNTMYVSELFKSPIKNGTLESDVSFASVPSELVHKVGRIPALFMFHTHPADPEACPLPSSHDLSTAIYYASAGRYAASMIISRYGILLYGINDEMLRYFGTHKDKKQAELVRLNFAHDVVAAHESIRSWTHHTMQEYVDFYKRYRMFLYIYPSSEFVSIHEERMYDLSAPVDYDAIESHYDNIKEFLHRKNVKNTISVSRYL